MHHGFLVSAFKSSRPMTGHDACVTCPKTQRTAVQRIGRTPSLPVTRDRFKGFGAMARKSLLVGGAKARMRVEQNGLTVTVHAI